MNTRYTATVLSLAAMLAAATAHAGEGVLEINQECATNGGCFAGDSAGFPVTISDTGNPRSYVLTSDLVLPADTDGIDISVANVSLDLNGFEIRGPESCMNTPVTSCSGSSAQNGVTASAEGTRVYNGSISGVAGSGITLADRARVSDVVVRESGGNGIALDNDGAIRNATARRNGGDGISSVDGTTIDGCRSSGNGDRGIDTSRSSVVTGSTVRNNAGIGISVLQGSVIRDSVARGNGGSGVLLFNTASTVVDSTINTNTNFGVECSFGSGGGLKGLILAGNNSGGNQYSSGCVELGTNLCNGNTTCP